MGGAFDDPVGQDRGLEYPGVSGRSGQGGNGDEVEADESFAWAQHGHGQRLAVVISDVLRERPRRGGVGA